MIRKLFILIPIVLLVVAVGFAAYFYHQKVELTAKSVDTSEQQVANVITAVGKLIILPENENPTVATVSDPAALKNQPFFADAEMGDKVLIYTKSKEAILYRPSINKIIAVSPLSFDNQSSVSSTSTTAPASHK